MSFPKLSWIVWNLQFSSTIKLDDEKKSVKQYIDSYIAAVDNGTEYRNIITTQYHWGEVVTLDADRNSISLTVDITFDTVAELAGKTKLAAAVKAFSSTGPTPPPPPPPPQ